MSATAVSPDAVVIDRRGRIGRFFRRIKNALKRAARSTIDWLTRAGRWSAAKIKTGARVTGRAVVRGTGYVGRFVTGALGLFLGGVEIVLAVALGFLMGVLTILGLGVMGIYSLISWPIHGLRRMNRKWVYTTFRWLSTDAEHREEVPLASYRAGRMGHEAQVSEQRAEKLADRIAKWTGMDKVEAEAAAEETATDDDVPEGWIRNSDGGLTPKFPQPNAWEHTEDEERETTHGGAVIFSHVAHWAEDQHSAPENYDWTQYVPSGDLYEAYKLFAEEGKTKKTRAHFLGRMAALMDFLAHPTDWDPTDPRVLSLVLQQNRGQQSDLPQKYIREGYTAQVTALKALTSV